MWAVTTVTHMIAGNGSYLMFKRLHTKNQYEGSGIGLATCHKIVNDHQGKIYVQSVPEGGGGVILYAPFLRSANRLIYTR